jgi:AraC family transcriptional regulator, transcriptional activator of pobA
MVRTVRIKEFYEHTYLAPVESMDFNVFTNEQFVCQPLPYNRRSFYKISLLDGKSRLIYADRGIDINQPVLIFSNPLVPYAFESLSEKQEGYFCLFKEGFTKSNLFKIGGDPVYFLDQQQYKFLSVIFENMIREMKTDYEHKFEVIKNYIDLLMHEALKMQPSNSYYKHQNAATKITTIFLELLDRQFPVEEQPLTLKTAAMYAEALSVHVNHLNHAVKEVTGKTTTELITERIINEASNLLKQTSLPISEIAFRLGYEYPTYFYNIFRKHMGVSPRSFRQTR